MDKEPKEPKENKEKEQEELNRVIKCEYQRIKENGILDFGIKVNIQNEDYTKWHITMTAPEDSKYKGGKYTLIAEFPFEYPLKNPKFTFQTKIYHCNVNDDNELRVNWLMKGMKMDHILPRLLTLFYLQDPNVDEKSERSQLYKSDTKEFDKNIKNSVEELIQQENNK